MDIYVCVCFLDDARNSFKKKQRQLAKTTLTKAFWSNTRITGSTISINSISIGVSTSTSINTSINISISISASPQRTVAMDMGCLSSTPVPPALPWWLWAITMMATPPPTTLRGNPDQSTRIALICFCPWTRRWARSEVLWQVRPSSMCSWCRVESKQERIRLDDDGFFSFFFGLL